LPSALPRDPRIPGSFLAPRGGRAHADRDRRDPRPRLHALGHRPRRGPLLVTFPGAPGTRSDDRATAGLTRDSPMSVLASLNRAYERLADRGEVPPFGYSSEKIGFLIPLNEDGTPAGLPIDLREGDEKRLAGPPMTVPQPVK